MKLRRLKKIESCGVRLATVYRNAGVLINIHEQFIGFFLFLCFFLQSLHVYLRVGLIIY